MKLWRLSRSPFAALDGSGPERHGARWTSPGLPVVNFASEAGLAVLVVLRYLPPGLVGVDEDYQLGWTHSDFVPERLDYDPDPVIKRARGDDWLCSGRSLFASVMSAVLPETSVIMMNPRHPDAATVPPLTLRRFSFADCLRLPKNDEPTVAIKGTPQCLTASSPPSPSSSAL